MAFEDLIGNKRVKKILINYLKNDIIPYSMIFSGPETSNILGFAIGYAKALNCLNSTIDFCDRCTHCIEASHDSFLDLRILYPDGQFYKKEQIVNIVNDNINKPLKGRKKIYILNSAHCMNEFSANAFLKVLEEPAFSSVFLLLTDNLNRLIPTIKSRCQILKFSPPSRVEIQEYLMKQGDDIEKAQLKSYLNQSKIENILEGGSDKFVIERSEVLTILSSLIQNSGVEKILLDLLRRSYSREKFLEYFSTLVNLLSFMLRDIMVLLIDSNNEHILNVAYKEELMNLSRYIKVDKALFLIRKMEFLLRDIQRNLNTKVLILEFIKSYTGEEVGNV
jgi:DNA polymerase-3 subunit delta'